MNQLPPPDETLSLESGRFNPEWYEFFQSVHDAIIYLLGQPQMVESGDVPIPAEDMVPQQEIELPLYDDSTQVVSSIPGDPDALVSAQMPSEPGGGLQGVAWAVCGGDAVEEPPVSVTSLHIGAIILHKSTIPIPPGWARANGNNGTVNLTAIEPSGTYYVQRI